MDNATLFSIASGIAFLGWLSLFFLPRPWRFRIVIGLCIPFLAIMYASMVFPALSGIDFMDFSTLEGVMKLQGNERAALVGWIHYLSFDLLAGWVIANDAEKLGISRLVIIPALLCTFMLGPLGWMLYVVIRLATRKKWLIEWRN